MQSVCPGVCLCVSVGACMSVYICQRVSVYVSVYVCRCISVYMSVLMCACPSVQGQGVPVQPTDGEGPLASDFTLLGRRVTGQHRQAVCSSAGLQGPAGQGEGAEGQKCLGPNLTWTRIGDSVSFHPSQV